MTSKIQSVKFSKDKAYAIVHLAAWKIEIEGDRMFLVHKNSGNNEDAEFQVSFNDDGFELHPMRKHGVAKTPLANVYVEDYAREME